MSSIGNTQKWRSLLHCFLPEKLITMFLPVPKELQAPAMQESSSRADAERASVGFSFPKEFIHMFLENLQEEYHGPRISKAFSKDFEGTAELLDPVVEELALDVQCIYNSVVHDYGALHVGMGVRLSHFVEDMHDTEDRERLLEALDNCPGLQFMFQGMLNAAERWVRETSNKFIILGSAAGACNRILVGESNIFFLRAELFTVHTNDCDFWMPRLVLDVVHRHNREGVTMLAQEAAEKDDHEFHVHLSHQAESKFLAFMMGVHAGGRQATNRVLPVEVAQLILHFAIPRAVQAQELNEFLLNLGNL